MHIPQKSNSFFLVFLLLIIVSILAGGLWTLHHFAQKKEAMIRYQLTQKFLNESNPEKALAILRSNPRLPSDPDYNQWLNLEIQAFAQQRNLPRLIYLYERQPAAFFREEKASLLIARFLLKSGYIEQYEFIRKLWRNRATESEAWFAIDVDNLIATGKRDEALELLRSTKFEGSKDCGRILRMALLTASDNLAQAWDLLAQAYRMDPKNTDVRLFRAQILESIGRPKMARLEYVAALLADPQNLLLRDQLAEFYRRTGLYRLALETWYEGLDSPNLGFIWTKALFWNKVTHPLPFSMPQLIMPSDGLESLIEYLVQLPPGQFWDEDVYNLQVIGAQRLLEQRQELFWLRLLDALKNGKEDAALDLLKNNTFKANSYNPNLETILYNVLLYRRWRVMVWPEEERNLAQTQIQPIRHQFFEQMMEIAQKSKTKPISGLISEDLNQLLLSDEVFSAVFLAAGWMEAALQLNKTDVIPNQLPEWIAYGLAKAMENNRSGQETIDFILKQRQTSALKLVLAEAHLANGDSEGGMKILSELSKDDSAIGFRAAWILGLLYLNQEKPEQAEQILEKSPQLRDSITGKELLARIALNRGREREAGKIYQQIATVSYEAKSYLARKAFDHKDWDKAEQFTEELMMAFPDQLKLRENLLKIAKAKANNHH